MKWKHALALVAILSQQAFAPLALAARWAPQASGTVSGFVIPNEVMEKEPFTFAATGTVEGEVVTVQTVDGVVVERKQTDKLGRVFVAAGLAAGLYMLTRERPGGGGAQAQFPIEVKPHSLAPTSQGTEIPKFVNLKEGLTLRNSQLSGDARQLAVSSPTGQIPVLASTPRELKTGPIPGLQPGSHDLTVRNLQSGAAIELPNLICYALASKLTQQKVGNGQMTLLEFQLSPPNVSADVKATITKGPVHFQGGQKETIVQVRNGLGKAPILADPVGSGPFSVAWTLGEIWMNPGPAGNPAGQDAKPKKCPATAHIPESTGGWKKSEVKVYDKAAKKWTTQYVLRRVLLCHIHSGCKKDAGHGGDHDFTRKKRCDEREPFTDSNGNGTWDENDGPWDPKTDDADKDGKPSPGEYTDNDGDGKYTPPEKFEDKNKDGVWHGDPLEEHRFDSKEDRDRFAKDNP